MLAHLDEKEIGLYHDILKVRALGRELTEEEHLVSELFRFDFHAARDPDQEVRRVIAKKEEDLIARIDSSDLSDGTKMKLLRCFSATPEFAAKTLAAYSWLHAWPYKDQNPSSGRLGLVFNTDVTSDEFTQMQLLKESFDELGGIIAKTNTGGRLIMTDDIPPLKAVREMADKEWAEHKEAFHYGIALPPAAQDLIDGLVRNHKKLIQRVIETGAGRVLFNNFNVTPNAFRDTALVVMNTTGDAKHYFGFYFNPRFNRNRQEWADRPRVDKTYQPRETLNEVKPAARPVDAKPVVKPAAAPISAIIPEIPKRVKPAPALSAKPMVIPENAPSKKQKQQKSAPKKRKPREILRLHSS